MQKYVTMKKFFKRLYITYIKPNQETRQVYSGKASGVDDNFLDFLSDLFIIRVMGEEMKRQQRTLGAIVKNSIG